MLEVLELGDWSEVAQRTRQPRVRVFAATPPPEPSATPALPPPPPVSPIDSWVPRDCATVKGLIYGGAAGAYHEMGLTLPDRIVRDHVVVIATQLPPTPALSRDRVLAQVAIITAQLRSLRLVSVPGVISSAWELVHSGYVNALRIPYLMIRCIAPTDCPGGCTCERPARIQAVFQNQIGYMTGRPMLSLTGLAQNTSDIAAQITATVLAGAVEDFRAAMVQVFQPPVAWDFRLELARRNLEVDEGAMRDGIRICTNADSIAAGYTNEARGLAMAVAAADRPEADRRLASIDSRVALDLSKIDSALNAATKGISADLRSYLPRLPTLIKSYVEARVARITDFDETRKLFISCRWWTEAESRYAAIESQLRTRIDQDATMEAWYPVHAPEIAHARDVLNAARREIQRIRESLNLAWYEKKYGPLTPIGWGVSAVGAGLLFKVWRASRAARI